MAKQEIAALRKNNRQSRLLWLQLLQVRKYLFLFIYLRREPEFHVRQWSRLSLASLRQIWVQILMSRGPGSLWMRWDLAQGLQCD